MLPTELSAIDSRRAIEALRSGVPAASAVRVLSSGQDGPLAAFNASLQRARAMDASGPGGIIVAGGFGTGKSHLLEELHQAAIESGFVSSRIPISKETPLSDPAKVLQMVVQSAKAKGVQDDLLIETAMGLRTDTAGYADLLHWCGSRSSNLSATFLASLRLREAAKADLDILDAIVALWSCDPLQLGVLRRGLREFGLADAVVQAIPLSERPWQTIRFLTRIFQTHGYRGWVVLLDEVELVGRYGMVARGRSYEQLARWLGLIPSFRVPGLAAVAAITDDFDLAILDLKGDFKTIPQRLGWAEREEARARLPFATAGMRAIRHSAIQLDQPDEARLAFACMTLRVVHSRAYGWEAPLPHFEYAAGRPMRSYVRRWINEWDLRRLYPDLSVDLAEEEILSSYEEDVDRAPTSDDSDLGSVAGDLYALISDLFKTIVTRSDNLEFSKPGWYWLATSDVACSGCDSPYEVFRRKVAGRSRRREPWGILCCKCHEVYSLNDFDAESMKLFIDG